ncbi:MAG: DUF2516 family protein [Candidatus Nanopelagicales bacterium]
MMQMAMNAVYFLMLAINVWALVDCLIRPAAAFPAVERQTKIAWIAFLGVGVAIQLFFGGVGLLGLAALVLAGYYLADVRTKVLEITRR